MAKTKAPTRDDLIKQNAALMQQNLEISLNEEKLRAEFSKLLGPYDKRPCTEKSLFSGSDERRGVMSWSAIFFSMGELMADANYSMLIQSREEMRREIEELRQKNAHPPFIVPNDQVVMTPGAFRIK